MKVLSTLLVPAAMLLALTLEVTSAFAPVQGSRSDARVSTARYAAAEKAETFKKQDFVKSIQDKTGLNKADSEQALTAVLETIQEVRNATTTQKQCRTSTLESAGALVCGLTRVQIRI